MDKNPLLVTENFSTVYRLSLDDNDRKNTSIEKTKELITNIMEQHIKGECTVVCYQMCTAKDTYDNYIISIFDNYITSVDFQNKLEYIEGIAIQVYQVTSLRYILVREKEYGGQCFRCYSGRTPEYIRHYIMEDKSPLYQLAEKLYNVKTAVVCVK
jgi:hypothetical protein